MAGNREYKSDVFGMLMENKSYALQVYNALKGSDYTDPELVEVKTLEAGISLTVRNDAAFVVNVHLNIYEHQASVCPNMPMRFLIYFTTIVQKMINKHDIYGKKLQTIPVPQFAVFYNGQEDKPEQYELRLSDAFEQPTDDPQLELKCRVYNINKGKNVELLDKCPVLREYMTLVDYIRTYYREHREEGLAAAISWGIDRCIAENILKEFLIENRSEVEKVITLDYTFERRLELQREEGREEGRAELIRNMLKNGRTSEEIENFVGCPLEEIKAVEVVWKEWKTAGK
jgi:hypothetical protein